MKEVEYRAWDGKKMFKVDVLAISSCAWDCGHGHRGVSLAYQPHIKVTEYTGLIDILGNKIFDRDLIKDDENFIWEVFYKSGAFYAKCDDLMAEQLLSSVNLYGVVIGNVFEKEDGHEGNKV